MADLIAQMADFGSTEGRLSAQMAHFTVETPCVNSLELRSGSFVFVLPVDDKIRVQTRMPK